MTPMHAPWLTTTPPLTVLPDTAASTTGGGPAADEPDPGALPLSCSDYY